MNGRLGFTYRDKITGFHGVATGHCEYLTGCNQTLLAPTSPDSSKLSEAHWFDDQRLERVSPDEERIVLDNGATPGSDKAAPKR